MSDQSWAATTTAGALLSSLQRRQTHEAGLKPCLGTPWYDLLYAVARGWAACAWMRCATTRPARLAALTRRSDSAAATTTAAAALVSFNSSSSGRHSPAPVTRAANGMLLVLASTCHRSQLCQATAQHSSTQTPTPRTSGGRLPPHPRRYR